MSLSWNLPEKNLRVSVVQLISDQSVSENVQKVLSALKQCEDFRPQLVSFPENTFYFRIRKPDSLQTVNLKETFWKDIVRWCQRNSCVVHIGGTPTSLNGSTFNSTIWVDENGPQVRYSKIHLFDVDVEGHKPVRESDDFKPGQGPSVIEFHGWRIGLSICYDLRFSELYSAYAKQNAHLILVPSAFLVPTGQAHWHTLLRARAIESQAFVVAAAQAGRHHLQGSEESRDTYGHSLIVDPWGRVLAEGTQDQAEVLHYELSVQALRSARTQIPMAGHRRL